MIPTSQPAQSEGRATQKQHHCGKAIPVISGKIQARLVNIYWCGMFIHARYDATQRSMWRVRCR